jgi:hypothetical protein
MAMEISVYASRILVFMKQQAGRGGKINLNIFVSSPYSYPSVPKYLLITDCFCLEKPRV